MLIAPSPANKEETQETIRELIESNLGYWKSLLRDHDCIELTISTDEDWSGYGWQTGDNSLHGGAYFYPHWALVYVYPDITADELYRDVISQLSDLINQ